MKYLSLIVLMLSLILGSCNNNDEIDLEIALPIVETYVPVSTQFNPDNIDEVQKRHLIHLVNNEHVVNDASELPDDPFGFGDAFHKINYKEYTLLVKYILHDWTIDTYTNRYYRNTQENTLNWTIGIGTASDADAEYDDNRFTRFAILVKRIPADTKVRTWMGLKYIGWYPAATNN